MNIKRTERGWAGHFCCADRCLFRRNTLLEYNNTKIVISTVGLMVDIYANGDPNKTSYTTIGYNQYYETRAFRAQLIQGKYWDADVQKEVNFQSPWSIDIIDAENEANSMHETVVDEITNNLIRGELYETI